MGDRGGYTGGSSFKKGVKRDSHSNSSISSHSSSTSHQHRRTRSRMVVSTLGLGAATATDTKIKNYWGECEASIPRYPVRSAAYSSAAYSSVSSPSPYRCAFYEGLFLFPRINMIMVTHPRGQLCVHLARAVYGRRGAAASDGSVASSS